MCIYYHDNPHFYNIEISIEYTITGFWYTDGQAILISV